jgi:integrase
MADTLSLCGTQITTVAQICTTFVRILDQAARSGRSSPKTRDWYAFQLAHLLRGKDARGQSIRERDAATLLPEDLAGLPYTYHCCRAVRRLFLWATQAGHIPTYRMGGFMGPPCGERRRTLSDLEYRKVMRAAGPCLKRVLWLSRYTLARPSELRNLRWRDVQLDEAIIVLKRFKARDKRRDGVLVRTIPLTQMVVRLLRWWKRVNKPLPDDHVVVNSRGLTYSDQCLRRAMHRATEAAGVNAKGDERIVCYSFRHTGATEATRRGVRDRTLADILGHSSTRTTSRYQHLGNEDLIRAMETATKPAVRPKIKIA